MPDAIVIGSGPNGLAAAIRLARAGRGVLVLEASDHAGGAVRSEELTLPGFTHDTFSSVYPAAAASPVFADMPLAAHGLEWVHPEACMAHPLPGGAAAVLHRDVDRTAAGLDALAPGHGARWRSFIEPYLDAFDAVRHILMAPFPPLPGAWRLLTEGGLRPAARFAAFGPLPARMLGRRLFSDPRVRAWLYGSGLHSDAPPTRAGSAMAAFYLQLLGHAVGWPSPRGGAGELARALTSYATSLGVEIRTGTRVAAIDAVAGRVAGVRTAGGERIGSHTVLADVMPAALVELTGDALAAWYRAALRTFRQGPATLKLDWALDGPIPWSAPEVRGAGTVHVGGDEDDLLESFAQADRTLPERPFMLLGQQSVADPGRAPAGRHTAWAYTHATTAADWSPEQIARLAERMEAQVERFAPGFRDRILARHELGPRDLERRNANLVDGDIGGGSYRLRQLVFRPIPKLSPYRTPLNGLYLCSAATFPGGAVHGVCGDGAARAALRQD